MVLKFRDLQNQILLHHNVDTSFLGFQEQTINKNIEKNHLKCANFVHIWRQTWNPQQQSEGSGGFGLCHQSGEENIWEVLHLVWRSGRLETGHCVW